MSKLKQSKQVKQAKRAQHTHAMGKTPKGHAGAQGVRQQQGRCAVW